MSMSRSLTILSIIATASLAAASASAQAAGVDHSAPRAASQAETAKRAACERVWAAQKVRHGTHQAFVAACVAKG